MAFKPKMRCPACNSKAFLTKTSIELFDGAFRLKDNPIYYCINCGEQFATGKMVDEADKVKDEIVSKFSSPNKPF